MCISESSCMNLYQLGEIVIESSKELLEHGRSQGDCLVFFGDEHSLYSDINVQLRKDSNNNFILVFHCKK